MSGTTTSKAWHRKCMKGSFVISLCSLRTSSGEGKLLQHTIKTRSLWKSLNPSLGIYLNSLPPRWVLSPQETLTLKAAYKVQQLCMWPDDLGHSPGCKVLDFTPSPSPRRRKPPLSPVRTPPPSLLGGKPPTPVLIPIQKGTRG